MKPPRKSSPSQLSSTDRIAKWSTMAISLTIGGLGVFLLLRLSLHTMLGVEGVYKPFQGLDLPANDWTSWAMGPVFMILGLLGWRMAAALFATDERG